jgi:hypothetical protein
VFYAFYKKEEFDKTSIVTPKADYVKDFTEFANLMKQYGRKAEEILYLFLNKVFDTPVT